MCYPLIIMNNLYQYLCNDPDMDLSPIREKSERLYHDILRERQFYADNPDCDNVHFFHLAKQTKNCSYWVDRWGSVVLSYKVGMWAALRAACPNSPAMRKRSRKGYLLIGIHNLGAKGCIGIHQLMADAFLPNTDFTKCEMDHLNSEHLDNNALNLERVSHEENIRRRVVMLCHKKGKPIPEKYQSLKNYLNYLQSKKSKL